MAISLEDDGQGRTRWFDYDQDSAFLVRYGTPLQMQRWRRALLDDGIMRETKAGAAEVARGREMAYYQRIAAEWVVDWRGIRAKADDAEDAPYTAAAMARLLAGRAGVLKKINEWVEDEESFFGPARPTSGA